MSESMTFDEAVKKAGTRGLVVRVPEPYELFIDIDSEDQLARFGACFNVFREIEQVVTPYKKTPSPSGGPGTTTSS